MNVRRTHNCKEVVLAAALRYNGEWPADRKLPKALRRHINLVRRLDSLTIAAHVGLNWRGIQKAHARLKTAMVYRPGQSMGKTNPAITYAGEPMVIEAQQDLDQPMVIHTLNMICLDENCALPHSHDALAMADERGDQ